MGFLILGTCLSWDLMREVSWPGHSFVSDRAGTRTQVASRAWLTPLALEGGKKTQEGKRGRKQRRTMQMRGGNE